MLQNGDCYKNIIMYLYNVLIQTKKQMNYKLNLWTIHELQKQENIKQWHGHGRQCLRPILV